MSKLSKTVIGATALLPVCALAALTNGNELLQKVRTSSDPRPVGAQTAPTKVAKTELKQKVQKKAPQLPQANTAGLPYFEGFVAYSMPNANKGWYCIPTSEEGEMKQLTEESLGLNNVEVYQVVKKDGILYVHTYSSSWFGETVGLRAFDAETGVQKGAYTFANSSSLAQGAATDPTTGEIYSIMYGNHLAKVDYYMDTTTFASPTPQCTISNIGDPTAQLITIACDNTGQLYGLDYDGNLYKVDKTDASVEFVGASGLTTYWNSSATIDSHSNRMFYSILDANYDGYLVEIDLHDGSASLIYDYPNNLQVIGLAANFIAEPTAPAAATDLQADFDGVELNGTLTFSAPTKLFDGTEASGAVDYKVFANDEEVAEGSTEYGKTVTVSLELSKSGSYTFKVVFYNEAGGAGEPASIKKYVGLGELNVPEDVKVDYADYKATISWAPVTESIDGSYVDAEKVTYTVTRSDGKTVAEGIAETTTVDTLDEPDELTSYYYEVVANYLTASSAAATSPVITVGCIALPFSASWVSGSDLSGYTIIDGYNDGKTWELGTVCMMCTQSASCPKDEYFVLPPVKLKAGNVYDFSFEAEAQSGSMPETLEVVYGTAPTAEALNITALEPVVLGAGGRKTCTGQIAPTEDGEYYIAFHAISEPDMWNLRLYSMTLEEGRTTSIPGVVENLKIETEPYEYDVKLTFNAPTTQVNGKPLETVNIEVLRDEESVNVFDEVEAGSKVSYVDTPATPGSHTYKIRTYNENGEGSVVTETIHVYGYLPMPVSNVTIEEGDEDGTVNLKWDAVLTDVLGQVVPAGKITYSIYDIKGELVAEGITTNRWAGSACEPGEQKLVGFTVAARTDVGEGFSASSEGIVVGTPYQSLHESFADGHASSIIAGGTVNGYGTYYLATDSTFEEVESADGDNGYIFMSGPYIDDEAELFTGYVSLSAEDPYFSFMVYNLSDGVNQSESEVSVFLKEKRSSVIRNLFSGTVAEIAEGQPGWAKKTLSLSAYKDKAVQVFIRCRTVNFATTPFDCLVVDGTNAVGSVAAANTIAIIAGNSSIAVSNAEGENVTIASIDGKVVYSTASAPADLKVEVASGYYIVKAADKTAKIQVR